MVMMTEKGTSVLFCLVQPPLAPPSTSKTQRRISCERTLSVDGDVDQEKKTSSRQGVKKEKTKRERLRSGVATDSLQVQGGG